MSTPEQTSSPAGDGPIPCSAAAEGVAVGKVHLLRLELDGGDDPGRMFSVAELHHAVDLTHDQLESFQRRIHSRIEESVAQVFQAHLAILHDKDLMDWIEGGIRAGRPAVAVIREAYGHHIELFSRSPVARLREKVQDLQDIASRLVRNLRGGRQAGGGLQGRIVVAHDLYPSDLLRLVAQDVAGVVLVRQRQHLDLRVLEPVAPRLRRLHRLHPGAAGRRDPGHYPDRGSGPPRGTWAPAARRA